MFTFDLYDLYVDMFNNILLFTTFILQVSKINISVLIFLFSNESNLFWNWWVVTMN